MASCKHPYERVSKKGGTVIDNGGEDYLELNGFFLKDIRDTELTNKPLLHLISWPPLPPLQSQNPQRSLATPAVLLNQGRQI